MVTFSCDTRKFVSKDTPAAGNNNLLFEQIRNTSGINAALIIKDEDIVFEYYRSIFPEYPETKVEFQSCTKSIVSILMGIAIDKGLIENVDVKISKYFPELEQDSDTRKKEIAIRHLLDFTAGFKPPEYNAWVNSLNWVDFVLNRPMAASPGEQWEYNSGASHLLSAILQKASGTGTLSFAMKHLFGPLGIEDISWRQDPQGVTTGAFGLMLKPKDAVKIGLLYLHNGKYEGKQIVSSGWVKESTRSYSMFTFQDQVTYGFNWWINEKARIPFFYAMGYGGQYILIAPKINVVAVFTSNLSDNDYFLPSKFFDAFLNGENGI